MPDKQGNRPRFVRTVIHGSDSQRLRRPGWAFAWNFPAWAASPAGQFEASALAATTAAPPSPYYSQTTVERALARALKGHPYTAAHRDPIARSETQLRGFGAE